MELRQLKKRQTRARIADAAWRLFADRGFDQVTVADVADEAQVSLATVFNYFPAKDELFSGPLEAFGASLVEAVRARDAGEAVLAAYQRFLDHANGLLAQIEAGDATTLARARTINRVIANSPALQAYERQSLARTTDSLAALIAEETGAAPDDVHAHVVANALMGVHHALLQYVRRRLLSGTDLTHLATDVRDLSTCAFALLEHGLAGYAPKPREVGVTVD